MGPIKIYCLTLVVQRWIQRLCSSTKRTRERRWRDVLGRHSKPRGGWGAFYPSDSNRHSLIFPFNISTTLSWGICQDNVRNAAMFLNQLPYYWKPGDLSAKDLQLLLKRCSNDLFLTRRCYLCAAHISFSPESGYLKFFFFLGYLKCTNPLLSPPLLSQFSVRPAFKMYSNNASSEFSSLSGIRYFRPPMRCAVTRLQIFWPPANRYLTSNVWIS